MADRSNTHEAALVPSAEPTHASYEGDLYSWSLEQARLIRGSIYRQAGWEKD
jgi:hypothetical protein